MKVSTIMSLFGSGVNIKRIVNEGNDVIIEVGSNSYTAIAAANVEGLRLVGVTITSTVNSVIVSIPRGIVDVMEFHEECDCASEDECCIAE